MNYYALLVALVIVTALLMRGYRQGNKAYVIVACLLLFAIFGLRDTLVIGVDPTSSYLHLFERMPTYSWTDVMTLNGYFNVGYYLLNKLVYELSGDYQLMITMIAAFVTLCFGRLIYRYSPNPLQSILYHFGLLFFTFHFSALKQSIAMAFLMLAFDFIVERKAGRFVLLVLIAALFHAPSLIFLPAYWISKINAGRRYLLILAGTLLVTYILRTQIVNLMLTWYGSEDVVASSEGIQFLRTKTVIMIVIVVAALILRVPSPDDRVYNILMEFMGIAIVLQTFCGYNNIFERLADYYFQFSVLFIPLAFDKTEEHRSRLNRRSLYLVNTYAPYVFCAYAIYRFLVTTRNDGTLYPFKFFFQ